MRALFDELLARVQTFGELRVLPEKTRIAFQVRMSFAQVTPRRTYLLGHLVLGRRVDDPIFRKVESFSRRNHVHHFRLDTIADLTPRFMELWKEAYDVGCQRHLE